MTFVIYAFWQERADMAYFRDITGHEMTVGYLQQAVRSGNVNHAYLISGAPGSGKTLVAEAFAQALLCERGEGEACGECPACIKFESGNHPDMIRVIHEKPLTIRVDEIREQVVSDIEIRPYLGGRKVYLIDEAEKMNVSAQNALLKTLEEPPEYAVILLLTENRDAMLPTILSRCTELPLRPLPDAEVRRWLMEEMKVPDYQADLCTAFAQGSIGKARKLAASGDFNNVRTAALRLVTGLRTMDIATMTEEVSAFAKNRQDALSAEDLLDVLAVWFRDVLYFKATRNADGVIFKDQIGSIREEAGRRSYEGIEAILRALQKAGQRLRANVDFELTIELLLLTIREN